MSGLGSQNDKFWERLVGTHKPVTDSFPNPAPKKAEKTTDDTPEDDLEKTRQLLENDLSHDPD